jgi:hypothetical protein
MTISVVNTGTFADVIFNTTHTLQWTLSPTPSATNALILPYFYENAANTVIFNGTMTDNQGNTYTALTQSSNTTGISGAGGISCGLFYCPSIATNGGNYIVTINSGSGTTRVTLGSNHIEVSGLNNSSPLDQTGTHNNGGTAANTETVTASGANVLANELVVAVYIGILSQFFGPGAPATGYTEICNNIIQSNSLDVPMEAAYKIVSGIETSSAVWTVGSSKTALAASLIATFKQAAAAPPSQIPIDWYIC